MRPWLGTCIVYWVGTSNSKEGIPATWHDTRDVNKHSVVYKHAWLAAWRHIPPPSPNPEWLKYGSAWHCGGPQGKGLDKVSEKTWQGNPTSAHGMLHCGRYQTTHTSRCFCLPTCSERSHFQLSGRTAAWGCPCHPHSPHLHGGGKNLFTVVTWRALRRCSVKHWVNVNDSQVTKSKEHLTFLPLFAQGMEGEEVASK